MSEASLPNEAADVAAMLAERFAARGQEYALGGAIALGYWGIPRGTVDVDVTVFVPLVPFYETARARRKSVELRGRPVLVWDAESLAVFKMMFFRRKDLADIEQVLTTQGAMFDRPWVRGQLVAMYGLRDPRLAAWDELVQAVPAE